MNVEDLLERHRAFWARDTVNKPLVHLRRQRKRFEHMEVSPEMLDPRDFTLSGHETLVQDDLFRTECAFGAIPWMEAICGCPIVAGAGEAMWPKPIIDDDFRLPDLMPREDNPWLQKLRRLTRDLVDSNEGHYLVTHTLMRGPMDILSALLGDTRMGLAFYDHPDVIAELLSTAADAFLMIARDQYRIIPPFHEGYAVWAYSVWYPGSVIRIQTDSSVQVSPEMYSDQILPHERRIMKAFDCALMDLHSGGDLPLYRVLIEEPRLTGISVTLDRHQNAPSIEQLVPIFREILKKKSLILFGDLTNTELDLLLSSLPPAGLCINATLVEGFDWTS